MFSSQCHVWVTRDETSDGPFCAALRACDLQPILEPVLTRRVVEETLQAIGELTADDWLVLTSPYAVEIAAGVARLPRLAVVGEPSRRVAETYGLRVELVGDGDGGSLFAKLRERVVRGRVCYARSAQALRREPWDKVELTCPVLYETLARSFDRGVVERVDVVSVASPTAVRAVGIVSKPFASIGSTTSSACRDLGIQPWVEATTPSFAALADAIRRAWLEAHPLT